MATLRETERDREIIDAILAANPHLRGNRSGAVRVALEAWMDYYALLKSAPGWKAWLQKQQQKGGESDAND